MYWPLPKNPNKRCFPFTAAAVANLATRDGRKLSVLLYPSGTREFVDVDSLRGDTSWSLWDYVSPLNAVVLFTTDGDRLGAEPADELSLKVSGPFAADLGAIAENLDAIVTRNLKDYKNSTVKVYSLTEFLQFLQTV